MRAEAVPEGRSAARTLARLFFGRRPDARGPEVVTGFLPEPWLERMFRTLAPRYDLQNRLLSVGRDLAWRRTFVERLRLEPGSAVGDLAVGTGEIAIAICARYRGVSVVGVDRSREMMRVARRKIRAQALGRRIRLLEGDLRDLPLGDDTLDAVTMSFGIRNVPERGAVLDECRRVLRPGGRLRIMEMVMPELAVVRTMYGWYFDHIMPMAGNLLSRTDYAYTYLRHSVLSFPPATTFLAELRACGFVDSSASPISWGLATIYRARKPGKRGDACR